MGDPVLVYGQTVWCLRTTQGVFAIKCVRSSYPSCALLQGEQIAAVVADRGIAAVAALSGAAGIIFTDVDQRYLVFPWCEGKVLSAPAVPSAQAYQIGELLGRLHLLNLQLPNVAPAYWQDFAEPVWQAETVSPELIKWSQQYRQAYAELSKERVISHGDLSQRNIIWRTSNDPWLVDWEAAGWVHPQVELLGVALNCAGVTDANLQKNIVMEVLRGYRDAGCDIRLDETVLYAGLGSWLKWILFNEDIKSAESQNIVYTVGYLTGFFPRFLDWFKNLI